MFRVRCKPLKNAQTLDASPRCLEGYENFTATERLQVAGKFRRAGTTCAALATRYPPRCPPRPALIYCDVL